MLADEIHLPVCPLTINGSFDIMPRMRDWHWVQWHPLTLTIHPSVSVDGTGPEAEKQLMELSYDAVMSGLEPQYQGYRENKDQ